MKETKEQRKIRKSKAQLKSINTVFDAICNAINLEIKDSRENEEIVSLRKIIEHVQNNVNNNFLYERCIIHRYKEDEKTEYVFFLELDNMPFNLALDVIINSSGTISFSIIRFLTKDSDLNRLAQYHYMYTIFWFQCSNIIKDLKSRYYYRLVDIYWIHFVKTFSKSNHLSIELS